jgi:pilus assembly protein CpaF
MNPIYLFQEDSCSDVNKVAGSLLATGNKLQNTQKLKMSGFKYEI